MKKEYFHIAHIPCCLWGSASSHLLLFVHGKGGNKEERKAEMIAKIAINKGYQLLSFDLAEHGSRQDDCKCDVFDGVKDLLLIYDWISSRYKEVSLIANSIGAYFSLQAFKEKPLKQTLLYSPVIDMPYLIGQMMNWFSVTLDELIEKKVIDTPIDPLRYDYYEFAMNHRVDLWANPISILFAQNDDLQTIEIMKQFCEKNDAKLTVVKGAKHPLMEEHDLIEFEKWIENDLK